MTPASTSPLPAVARAGDATLERSTSPPGAATTLCAPLRTTTCFQRVGGIGRRLRARLIVVDGGRVAGDEPRELARVRRQDDARP